MHRYHQYEFSRWWLIVGPLLWAVVLMMVFWPIMMENHNEPGIRHPVSVLMDISICHQLEGIPDGYCNSIDKEAP